MERTVRNIAKEYNCLLATARKRLQRSRVCYRSQRGRIQTVHINSGGVLVDLAMDDGSIMKEIPAMELCFD